MMLSWIKLSAPQFPHLPVARGQGSHACPSRPLHTSPLSSPVVDTASPQDTFSHRQALETSEPLQL